MTVETHYGETAIRLAQLAAIENAKRKADNARIALEMRDQIRASNGYDLVYTEYDDSLTDAQIDKYIDRDSADYAYLDADLDNWQSERAYDAAMEVLEELANRFDINLDDLDDDAVDELRGEVYEKDTSDPVEQLASTTPAKLFRMPLTGFDRAYDLHNPYDVDNLAGATIAVGKALADAGIEADKALRWAGEVLPEVGQYLHEWFTLDVIWTGTLTDIGDLKTGDTLTFTDPCVVLLDRLNGAGYDANITGTLTVTVGADHMPHLDSTGVGYGWNEVAGLSAGAYAADVTVTRKARG